MTAKTKDGNTVRVKPRQPLVDSIDELTILVRVPGQPAATRAFTDSESSDARDYAEKHGGGYESLPLADSNDTAATTTAFEQTA